MCVCVCVCVFSTSCFGRGSLVFFFFCVWLVNLSARERETHTHTERDRERETERNRQTDSQTDRQARWNRKFRRSLTQSLRVVYTVKGHTDFPEALPIVPEYKTKQALKNHGIISHNIIGPFSSKLDQRACHFPDEIETNSKHKTFNYCCISDVMSLEKWGKCYRVWLHRYFLCCEYLLVQIATFSWPSFVTWLKEGKLIQTDMSLKAFMIE